MNIVVDDLRGPEIAALLEAHLDLMRSQSPPESVHTLDLDSLRQPDVTFWTAWEGGYLLGCGALKQMQNGHGEIKSMHTAKAARGKGIAAKLLAHLEDHARSKGLTRLSLETGSQDGFTPARALYGKFGYAVCPPFGDYVEDPNSTFMTKQLA
ncbi:MAG: GNAT family N-acetyltransferase [Rhizobiaceae bacterium]|nr:GNAT family N-acetyltransferase [Rhizobiaceae bacterium]